MKRIDKLKEFIYIEIQKYSKNFYEEEEKFFVGLLTGYDDDYLNIFKENIFLTYKKYLNEISFGLEEKFNQKKIHLINKLSNLFESNQLSYNYINSTINNLLKELNGLEKPFTPRYFEILEELCSMKTYKYLFENGRGWLYGYSFEYEFNIFINYLKNLKFDKNLNEYYERLSETQYLLDKKTSKVRSVYNSLPRYTTYHNGCEDVRKMAIEKYNNERINVFRNLNR